MTMTERVEQAISFPLGGDAFRHRPLSVGDWDQIKVLQAMNGDRPCCNVCFDVLEEGTIADIGELCDLRRDGGFYVPGAAMEAAWRRHAYIDGC